VTFPSRLGSPASLPVLSLFVLVAGCSSAAPSEDVCAQSSQALSVCAGSSTVSGVDVSTYQGAVDWPSVKGSGRAFAIARVSDGTANPDDQFAANWKGMKSAGLVRGAYQFFRPEVDPTAQATLFLKALSANGGLVDGDLPPILDWEVTDSVADATADANAQTWLDAMEKGTGRKPLIYTALFMEATVGTGFSSYPLWVANYGVKCPSLPGGWSSWVMWQSADDGTVGTVSGGVDLDEFNGTLAELLKFVNAPAATPSDAGVKSHDAGSEAVDAGDAPDAAVPAANPDAGAAMGSGVTAPSVPDASAGSPCGH